jgi:uncharacterized protein YciI
MIEGAESITPEQVKANVARGKQYFLVLLNMGPTPRPDESLVAPVRMKHLQQQFDLTQQGKLAINGPVMGDEHLRGISIYAVDDIAEVKSFLAVDPMIVAGYLSAEIYPWMGMPGDRLP